MYTLRIRYKQLQKDIGLSAEELEAHFATVFGERVKKHTIYAWFRRRAIPVHRLAQLFVIYRFVTGTQLNFWRYIYLPKLDATQADMLRMLEEQTHYDAADMESAA